MSNPTENAPDARVPRRRLVCDGRAYRLLVRRSVQAPPSAPRLLIPAYQPNRQGREIVCACLDAIARYTPEEHEVWVVDNCSPEEHATWLLDRTDVNVALNRTVPVPRGERGMLRRLKRNKAGGLLARLRKPPDQREWGSYANAVGLELGCGLIDPATRHLMVMHMDTMPCREGWLSFLQSKLSESVRAAGVRMDTVRVPEGILHVIGYLVDYQLMKKLPVDFFPQMPHYDVGDRVTVALREAGYDVHACRNTLHNPELIDLLPADSPYRSLYMDRTLDDDDNVFFLHLGRAIPKAVKDYWVDGARLQGEGDYRREGKTMVEDWLAFAREQVLQ